MFDKYLQKVLAFMMALALLCSSVSGAAFALTLRTKAADFGGGSGTENDPYLISTKEHLNNVRNDLDAHYKMTADINFTEADFAAGGEYSNGGQGWEPIGGYGESTPFSGVFDGDGYSIIGLTFTVSSQDYIHVGLFGSIKNATVKNVTLKYLGISATGDQVIRAGGIAGYARQSVIDSCVIDGAVSAKREEGSEDRYGICVGGVAGGTYGDENSVVRNCSFNGTAYGDNSGNVYIGGIIGSSACSIIDCENNANISGNSYKRFVFAGGITGDGDAISYSHNLGTVTAVSQAESYVGGIVGDGGGNIQKCYNTGNLSITTGSVGNIGGIAGFGPYGENGISDCYNAGDIFVDCKWVLGTTVMDMGNGGGIFGSSPSYGVLKVERCYNVGKLTSASSKPGQSIGGIVGKMQIASACKFTNCYYLEGTAKKGIGCLQSGFSFNYNTDGDTVCRNQTEMQLQGSFENFDFDTVWIMDVNKAEYPKLRSYEESLKANDGIVLYSDYPYLSIPKGDVATFYIKIRENGEIGTKTDGIAFVAEDASILNLKETGVENGIRFVRFEGVITGTTTLTFTDSNTNDVLSVPVTVYDRAVMAYTLESAPSIYNFGGMYVDNYKYKINETEGKKTASVSFDVYNRNSIFGTVETYDASGKLYDIELIEKNVKVGTGIYEVWGEGGAALIQNFITGDLLSYRQTFGGYSTLTSIEIDVPENGYILICVDPLNSDYVNLINTVDMVLSVSDISGSIAGYSNKSSAVSKKLLQQIKDEANSALLDAIDLAELSRIYEVNLKSQAAKVKAETLWDFAVALSTELAKSDVFEDLLSDILKDLLIETPENIFMNLSGPAGAAMSGVFILGDVTNLTHQFLDFISILNIGVPMIQYNSGDFLYCNRVQVKSNSGFDGNTALSVFTLELEKELADKIKLSDPEVYAAIQAGKSYTYNISLIRDQAEAQPSGFVTVFIPVPEALAECAEGNCIKVYRVEEDGSLTDMDAWAENGMLTFMTEHFSLYLLAEVKAPEEIETDNTSPAETEEPSDSADTDKTDAPSSDKTDDDDIDDVDDIDESNNSGWIIWPIAVGAAVLLLALCALGAVVFLKKRSDK